MIIRFETRKRGIGDYLVNGKVRQTGIHRDEYDIRTPLHGSLEAIERDAKWISKYRSQWEGAYKHIVISYDESDVDKFKSMLVHDQHDMHREIVEKVLRANIPHRELSELNYYFEMHTPTRKHMLDQYGKKRKAHLHVAVSLLDQRTQRKLKFYDPKDFAYHSAVQSEICSEYGFLDPVTVMEKNAEQDIERVTPLKGKKIEQLVRQDLIEHLLAYKPRSGLELTNALREFEHIADVSEPITPIATGSTRGNRYLKIQINHKKERGRGRGGWRTINVRGKGLEFLDYLYDQYRVDTSDKTKIDESIRRFKTQFMTDTSSPFSNSLINSVFSDKLEPKYSAKARRRRIDSALASGANYRVDIRDNTELRRALIEEKRAKFLSKRPNQTTGEREEQIRRSKKRNIDESTRFINEFNKQQKQFYTIYKTNIDRSFLDDGVFFTPHENPNIHKYFSRKWKCLIEDNGDMILASTAKDSPLDKIADLMVQQALAKGWSLETIKATEESSKEFRAAIERAIERQKAGLSQEDKKDLRVVEIKIPTAEKFKEPAKNLYSDRLERELSERVNRRARVICDHAKSAVTPEMIKAILEKLEPLGRSPDFDSLGFERNDKKHLIIIVGGRRRYNAIDLLNKVLGVSVSDAVDEISRQIDLAKPKQEEVLDDDRGIGGGAGQSTIPEPEPKPDQPENQPNRTPKPRPAPRAPIKPKI
ncbi:hypothetical protein ACEWH9_00150 [Vibrio diabolicus]|uniref:hypothetical protein n=1 Tax=Vibrio harveyi group TaxID=717610 RepID=UPI00301C0739